MTTLFNVIILVLVISVVVDNFRLTFEYLRDAFARSFDYYRFIAAWIGATRASPPSCRRS